ncbi:MAG: hypothetical protein JWM31_125 [Solirubrobacterales bacterium]|nr:hypothetical protein [Solirubrobacterales bacterium]
MSTTADRSTAQLLTDLSEQTTALVRQELRLAQLELQQKGKRVGVGAGLFGAAGVVALYGGGALVAAAILALATALDGWLAALIVAVVLFVVAGVAALLGKKEVKQAGPPVPDHAVQSTRADLDTVKEAAHR